MSEGRNAALAPIILIGPMSAGKSTVAELLAQALQLPRSSLDELRWDYYAEVGYDHEEAKRIAESDGSGALLRFWKPFEAHAVERVLAEHGGAIVDFGAGHSVYEDPELFARVQRALAPYPHVILMLPSPDLDESVTILNKRFVQMLREEEGIEEVDAAVLAANEVFTRHPSNFKLAKYVAYTKNKAPHDTAEEIMRWLGAESSLP